MESKIAATHRLQREGRWDEASQYRDEVRQRLRAEGKKRDEAVDEAWAAMVEKYPPSEEPDVPNENTDMDYSAELAELIARSAGCETDLPVDIIWVYGQLANDNPTPSDAPSLGAWSLLRWARESPNRFFEVLLPKALVLREKVEGESPVGEEVEDLGIEQLNKC